MSISFTQYNVASTQYNVASQMDLVLAGRTLTSDLFDLGFNAVNSIVSICYDPSDNSFMDERDMGIAPIQLMNASTSELLKKQTGFAIQYYNSKIEMSLSSRLINHNSTSICMLEISDRDFYKIFKINNLLVNVLFVTGKCINAVAGFGAMETEWEPYTENNVVKFIIEGPPEYEGKQPPTGLIRTAYLDKNIQFAQKMRRYFDVIEKNGYSILIRKDAPQLFSSL